MCPNQHVRSQLLTNHGTSLGIHVASKSPFSLWSGIDHIQRSSFPSVSQLLPHFVSCTDFPIPGHTGWTPLNHLRSVLSLVPPSWPEVMSWSPRSYEACKETMIVSCIFFKKSDFSWLSLKVMKYRMKMCISWSLWEITSWDTKDTFLWTDKWPFCWDKAQACYFSTFCTTACGLIPSLLHYFLLTRPL